MIKSKICDLLGIKYPVIQGGMAWVADASLAAGGICDGRGVAAAFMLGAEAVQVGTRFLSAVECNVHQEYKDRILKTPFSKTFLKMESDPATSQENILAFGSGALRKAVQEGDRNGSYMAGECAGMVKRIEPAKDIVEDLNNEYLT